MMTDFKNLSPKQIERLAEKNRRASEERLREEMAKRGGKRASPRERYVYVDRSDDPKIEDADHRSIFKEFKKPPFSS